MRLAGDDVITVRRAKDRRQLRRCKQELWLTFDRHDRQDPLADGFGALRFLNEERFPPGSGVPLHPYVEAEIVTYVLEGAVAHEDSNGRSGVTRAGEFHRMTATRGTRHSETNASRTDWAHAFEIWLRPDETGLEPGHERRRFCAADRHGVLCVVASRDARRGSLRLHQDAQIYSALLDRGQHLVHELLPGRVAWLHVVRGEATLGDIVLSTGDGAGVTADRAVSVTAREESELLLLDLGARPFGPATHGGDS